MMLLEAGILLEFAVPTIVTKIPFYGVVLLPNCRCAVLILWLVML